MYIKEQNIVTVYSKYTTNIHSNYNVRNNKTTRVITTHIPVLEPQDRKMNRLIKEYNHC